MVLRIASLSLLLALLGSRALAVCLPADSTRLSLPDTSAGTTAEINVRVNYTSRAVFSGRDFGVHEWMSTPSITYYAKSGFYADLSGYYLSESLPHYELTALSVGYLGIVSSYFAVTGELSRTILSQKGQQNLLPYSADASVTYTISPLLSATTDYNLLFGNATAHRLRLSVSAYASRKITRSALGLKRVSLIPALTAILGTETSAFNLYQPSTAVATGSTATATSRRLLRIQQRLQARKNGTTASPLADTSSDKFGLMAVDLSVPIRITFTSFRIGLTNHVVRPFKIYADEELSTSALYYADVSLTWIIK